MAKRRRRYLRVSLEEIEPEIWRRVIVPTDLTLHDLHRIVQLMFEWYDYHLYQFDLDGARYEAPDIEAEGEDSTQASLSDFGWSIGDEFNYVYDFGDDWHHRIRVEKFPQVRNRGWLPYVVDGARRGPPEDCGGVHGYDRFVTALRNPDDPEHDEYMTWVGEDYDPELFDVRTVRHAVTLATVWERG